jgi:hypothetical protein
MKSRFALRIALPMMLLALAFAAVLWVGRASGTDVAPRSQASQPVSNVASGEKGAPDTSQWATASRNLEGVSISYRYPPGWSADLIYCAPGAETGQQTGHLPSGCVSTDLLVGPKAQDMGRIEGIPLSVDGKSAMRLVVSDPDSVLVSHIYTVMVYDVSGAPIFGISAQVGPDTGPSTLREITAALDGIVSTLRVEVTR